MGQEPLSLVLYRELSPLYPDIFVHPVWIHYFPEDPASTAKLIQELQLQVQQFLANSDPSSACQILLLCAAAQKLSDNYRAAIEIIIEARSIAENHGLSLETIWAAWGACSLYTLSGQKELAVKQLSWLRSQLTDDKDWILVALLEIIESYLCSQKEANDYLDTVLRWLVEWGNHPMIIEQIHLQNGVLESNERLFLKKRNYTVHCGSRWLSLRETIKRVLRGELRLEWVDRSERAVYPTSKNVYSQAGRVLSTNQTPSLNVQHPIEQKNSLKVQQPVEQKPSMSVYCLGQFCTYRDVELIDSWFSRKAQLVFKYLITHHQQAISKEILINVFWPDADPEAGRRNLHQAVYALRQILREKGSNFQPILFENDGYRLNPELDLWLDYEEFELHAQAGQALEQNHQTEEAMIEFGIAEGLYRDHFLVDDLYEDWAQLRRQTIWQTYLFISYRLAEYYLDRSEHAATISLCRRILAFDNSQEEAHLNLMKCYLAQGQRHLAINQYKLCFQALKNDLDLLPSAETQALYHKITKG